MAYENPADQTWVARFTYGKVPPAGPAPKDLTEELQIAPKLEEERKQKLVYLARVNDEVQQKKAELRTAFVFAVKKAGKEVSTLDDGAEALDEAVDTSRLNLMMQATDFLQGRRRYLEQPRRLVPGHEKDPLFKTQEIMDEVFTPLVREGMIPDDFVPDEYSAVREMISESDKLYLKDLEKYKPKEKSELAEQLKTGVGAGKAFAESIVNLKLPTEEAVTVNRFLALGEALFDTGADTVEAVRQQSLSGTQQVLTGVGTVLSNVMGSSGTVGKALLLGFKGAGTAVAMAGHLGGDEPNVDAFLGDLVGMVGQGFSAAGMATQGQTKRILGDVGPSVTTLLSSLLDAKKKQLIELVRKGEWTKVADLVGATLTRAAKTVISTVNSEEAMPFASKLKKVSGELADESMDEETKKKLEEEKAELTEKLQQLAEKTESVNEGITEGGKLLGEGAELSEKAEAELEKLELAAKAKNEQALVAEGQTVLERIEREQKEHQASLMALGKVKPDENDMKAIATLISKIERDRAIMQTALGLATAGTALLAEFFTPMAGTVTLVQFVGNLQAAAERAMAMRKWMAAQGDAVAAVSPYQTSISNFVKNQAEQFSHYAIKAALNLVKAATQFAAAGGLTAHVAKVAESAVRLAETAEELIYKQYQEKQLKTAWEITRQALANPQNRRLALKARALNPTLAKYTIAWGATVRQDAIAVSAMGRIGLDRETLARRDSTVGEVKRFLDTLYPDDLVVLGEYTDTEWAAGKPPPPALQVRVWVQTVAVAKLNKKVDQSEHGDVALTLKRVAQHEQTYLQASSTQTLTLALLDDYLLSVTMLVSTLETYSPTLEGGAPSKAMKELSEGFLRLADAKQVELMQAQVELQGEIEKQRKEEALKQKVDV